MMKTSRVQLMRLIAELLKRGMADPVEIKNILVARCHMVSLPDVQGALAELEK